LGEGQGKESKGKGFPQTKTEKPQLVIIKGQEKETEGASTIILAQQTAGHLRNKRIGWGLP